VNSDAFTQHGKRGGYLWCWKSKTINPSSFAKPPSPTVIPVQIQMHFFRDVKKFLTDIVKMSLFFSYISFVEKETLSKKMKIIGKITDCYQF